MVQYYPSKIGVLFADSVTVLTPKSTVPQQLFLRI